MPFPFQFPGTLGGTQNPTLLPNFYRPFVKNGSMDLTNSPELAKDLGAGVPSEGSVTFGGTASGGTVTLTIANGVLTPSVTLSYAPTSSDTVETIAAMFAGLINSNPVLRSFGFWGDDNGLGELKVFQRGPVGNFTTLSASTTGAQTFTIVQMTGGSGPVVPLSNFTFAHNGTYNDYYYALPYAVNYHQLSEMVAQGIPVS